MKSRNLIIPILTCLIWGNSVFAAGISFSNEKSEESTGMLSTVIKAVQDLQNYRKELTTKNVELEFETNFTFPRQEELKKTQTEIEAKKQLFDETEIKIRDLKKEIYDREHADIKNVLQLELENEDRNILGLKEKIFNLQTKAEELKISLEERKTKQAESIKKLTDELHTLEEEVEKQKTLIQTQFNNFLINLAIFVAIVLFLLFLRFISAKVINHAGQALTVGRRKALLKINKITFDVIIGIVILGIISSQFINILPFLAIFGTGLAWALRAPVSSFIGWFVIGSERGYRLGQMIQLGTTYGRVSDIGSFLTVIQEFDKDEPTGKMISVPNKIIFEKEIINYSKSHGFNLEKVTFAITPVSDPQAGEDILTKIINEVWPNFYTKEDSPNAHSFKRFTQNFHIKETEIQPRVWVESAEKKILIKARYYAHTDDCNTLKPQITKKFLEAIKNNKNANILHIKHYVIKEDD